MLHHAELSKLSPHTHLLLPVALALPEDLEGLHNKATQEPHNTALHKKGVWVGLDVPRNKQLQVYQ